ncbi:hypothetical protein ACFLY6_03435, partial [Candidatus Dependentiae bacterium]
FQLGMENLHDCISCKIYTFGTVSLCYKASVSGTFEALKVDAINVVEKYAEIAKKDVEKIFAAIKTAIKKPVLFNLDSDYYAVQLEPAFERLPTEEFKDTFGGKIASLLRLETETLSEYQQDSILASTTGYYGEDFIIIDSEAAFVYDDEYSEAVEFLELANIQRLELQCFDMMLDQKLSFFYNQEAAYKPSLGSYVPLVRSKVDRLLEEMARLRVDVSVITERLGSDLKMVGDAYFEQLYSMIADRLQLSFWRKSISKKLNIISDLYQLHHNQQESIRNEIMMVIIIVLIALEAAIAFLEFSGHLK